MSALTFPIMMNPPSSPVPPALTERARLISEEAIAWWQATAATCDQLANSSFSFEVQSLIDPRINGETIAWMRGRTQGCTSEFAGGPGLDRSSLYQTARTLPLSERPPSPTTLRHTQTEITVARIAGNLFANLPEGLSSLESISLTVTLLDLSKNPLAQRTWTL